jgi:hypothetical protein
MRRFLLSIACLSLSLPLSAQAPKRHLKEAGREGKAVSVAAVRTLTATAKAGAQKAKAIGQGAKEAGSGLSHALRDAAKKLKEKVDE